MARKYNHPPAVSKAVRARMQSQRRGETACELALRSRVHSLGLRYRLHQRPLPHLRREADMVFRKAKVAVFVDGCFWHGCPEHGSIPKTHSSWWRQKIARTVNRDRETNAALVAAGWLAIRVWEHEDVAKAARRVARAVRSRAT